jgi:hypothetical protein
MDGTFVVVYQFTSPVPIISYPRHLPFHPLLKTRLILKHLHNVGGRTGKVLCQEKIAANLWNISIYLE